MSFNLHSSRLGWIVRLTYVLSRVQNNFVANRRAGNVDWTNNNWEFVIDTIKHRRDHKKNISKWRKASIQFTKNLFRALGLRRSWNLYLSHFHYFFNCCAASPIPQVVSVTLKSQDGIILGRTRVTYGTNLQQVVSCPGDFKKLCEYYYMSGNPSGNPSGNSGGETESSRTLGKLSFN